MASGLSGFDLPEEIVFPGVDDRVSATITIPGTKGCQLRASSWASSLGDQSNFTVASYLEVLLSAPHVPSTAALIGRMDMVGSKNARATPEWLMSATEARLRELGIGHLPIPDAEMKEFVERATRASLEAAVGLFARHFVDRVDIDRARQVWAVELARHVMES